MKRRGASVLLAIGLVSGAPALHAQSSFKSANDLAKKCISDNRSLCLGYIEESIEALESGRKSRGEPLCFAGEPTIEEAVKTFVRAVVTKYAYSDLTASAAVEKIYADNCPLPN